MKQTPSNTSSKYNVAWFKLAEFVARGERERALGIYRLLVHTISDRAFALQLEGDLLLAFDDEKSLDLYIQAAALYEKSERFAQAAAICEHLITIRPEETNYRMRIINLYKQLGTQQKLNEHRAYLSHLFLVQNQLDKACDLLAGAQKDQDIVHCAGIHRNIAFYLIRLKYADVQRTFNHLQQAMDNFLLADAANELKQFMSELKVISGDMYQRACEYLEHENK